MLRNISSLVGLLCPLFLVAQQDFTLQIASSPTTLPQEINLSYTQKDLWQGGTYRIIQFKEWPTISDRNTLKAAGVQLLDYLPTKAYYAYVPARLTAGDIQQESVRAIAPVSTALKTDPSLVTTPYPAYAQLPGGALKVQATVFKHNSVDAVQAYFQQHGIKILQVHPGGQIYELALTTQDIARVASFPFVQYLNLTDPPGEPENYTGRTLHRSNVIDGAYAGSRQYDGTGIHVQMQDDGGIGPHIDYTGRVPKQFSNNFDPNDDHGDHVAGIIMGAGNLDPEAKGMAPGAELYVYEYEPMNDSIVSHYSKYDLRITSTSYSNGCNRGYSATARDHDQEIRLLPELMHVFSAGNSNGQDCGYGAGSQWGNITGGHKVGKNVIAVANLNSNDGIANSSSRGPAHDGRIKPDISGKGTQVLSTLPGNNYARFTGTSMSCPGISGSLAQLYHAYHDLNGQTPPSALIKAIVLNTAEDLGNPGPDFIFGWGRINNLRAVEALEQQTYFSDTIAQGGQDQFTLAIPSGVVRARIMVYWHDYEAVSGATKALVNDLDLTVEDPSNMMHLPYTLNTFPDPDSLNSPAVPGIDRLNNVEQIEIHQPTPGNYTLQITGHAVPQGPQAYFVVYTYFKDEIAVTYPAGGEPFTPGATELIRWDAVGDTGSFTIEYSLDKGSSWTTAGNAFGFSRTFGWTVPDTAGEALLRISRGNIADQSNAPFYILDRPANLGIDTTCCDHYVLSWDSVDQASHYVVYQLGNKYMEPIDTVQETKARIAAPREAEWYSVAALKDSTIHSQRTVAIEVLPGLKSNCIQPGNIVMEGILQPGSGSINACSDPAVTVLVGNSSGQTVYQIPVAVSIGNQVSLEAIDSIPAYGQLQYTFTSIPPFAISGTQTITAWVAFNADINTCDDTVRVVNEIIASPIATLPYVEDFESFFQCNIDPNCGETNCPLGNGWYNETNGLTDDIDWRVDFGGTFSNQTGPSLDARPGTIFGSYIYTEASGGCEGQEAILSSPCFDLSGTTQPLLTFAYHMYGIEMGQLVLDLQVNGVWIENHWTMIGNQGDMWHTAQIDLSSYKNDTIAFRLRGTTGNGYRSDIALDFIYLYDNVPAQAGIEAPDTACINQFITVADKSSKIDLNYTWDFGVSSSPASASGVGPHNVLYSTAGQKSISLIIEENGHLDTAFHTVEVLPPPDATFTTNGNGLSVDFTPLNTNAVAYVWDFGDGDSSTSTLPTHQYDSSGNYTVSLTLTTICGTVTYTADIGAYPVGKEPTNTNAWRVTIQPNPADHQILIVADQWTAAGDITIYNVLGEIMYQHRLTSGDHAFKKAIDVSQWPAGTYTAVMKNGQQQTSRQLVIQH